METRVETGVETISAQAEMLLCSGPGLCRHGIGALSDSQAAASGRLFLWLKQHCPVEIHHKPM